MKESKEKEKLARIMGQRQFFEDKIHETRSQLKVNIKEQETKYRYQIMHLLKIPKLRIFLWNPALFWPFWFWDSKSESYSKKLPK
jgi:hypothetical protein